MNIIKTDATITKLTPLSRTAMAVTFTNEKPLEFEAGSFVNVFIEQNGEMIRRAYSLSTKDSHNNELEISVRKTINGKMSPLFWNTSSIGMKVSLMGPLGVNTADKMHAPHLFLFGFGIGAGAVKALLEENLKKNPEKYITLVTGSRTIDEIIYKDYFDTLANTNNNFTVDYVLSDASGDNGFKKGYIQNHLARYDFNNSDVFVCGQEVACLALVDTVKATTPENCTYYVEGFH